MTVAPEAEQAGPNDAAMMNISTWKGSIMAQSAVMGGVIVAVVNGTIALDGCVRECHRQGAGAGNFTGGCNAVNFCELQGGCSYQDTDLGREQVALLFGQCGWAVCCWQGWLP